MARQLFVSSPPFFQGALGSTALFPTPICMLFPTSVRDFSQSDGLIYCVARASSSRARSQNLEYIHAFDIGTVEELTAR